jgi:hypothetical protein
MNLETMSREDLLTQAEALELDFPKQIRTETLLKMIQDELNGTESKPTPKPSDKNFVEIMFSKDPTNKQPVFIGVNGKSFRFPRGQWTKCPSYLLPTIRNCKQSIRDDETGDWMEVETYPFQVRGE